MNGLKKAYCRVFQTVFKIALPILPYREPKIMNSVGEITTFLKEKNVRSALLVTDGAIRKLGLTKELEDSLKTAKIKCSVYDEVVPNPTIDNVESARKLYLDNRCQVIIALGGGSAMDCAKGCGARIARPNKPIPKMKGILKVWRRTPITIAVPTTAGTGSEATLAALTTGLPRSITATTGMDALTHAVEAYIGNSTTKLTRTMSEEAVTLIYENLYKADEDGQNIEARRAMLRAAYCAGVSFTRSYVGYVHGIAHSLGGQYGVAHGLANAVILPYFLDEYGPSIYKKLGKLARISGVADKKSSDKDATLTFIDWVKEMNAKMQIPTKIPEIKEEDIAIMAKHADKESNPLYPVPVLMNAKELEVMYRRLMPEQ